MAPVSTARADEIPAAGTAQESRLDRLGIPHPLRWGFLGVLVFMTGNGVETNVVSPHIANVFGGGDAMINLAATVITVYSLAALVGSYLAGALSDLWGPRRVMLLGVVVWVVFQAAFVAALATGSIALIFGAYLMRGFGFPLFAFSFLVWVNAVVPKERNGAAVGWFYVMFTGGMPTLGSLVAIGLIPAFGGGFFGERWAMVASTAIVIAGFLIARLGVREEHGDRRLAPAGESSSQVILSGVRLALTNRRVMMGFLTRLINTAPQFGMFIILPTVIAETLGWGQSRWLLMTSVIFAGNILFNAAFGALGDRIGWTTTVRWFGIVGSALGLLLWWYVPHWVPAGSDWGFVVAVVAGTVFGILLAGFVPLGAIMPALAPAHKGAAMAMYTTAAGGATFLGSAVVAVVRPWGGDVGVVWAFVALYGLAFLMTFALTVEQPRVGKKDIHVDA
ncbi:RbtT/DalT/CsbX family MFS transporter [Brachybacterium saurashtrense]|uniref:MFS transporter n=1 Tax=Brachybacterium saurashtrense TaxID=556288 RepID=A0A345YR18_9MICO|nr:RbtT/DalT/CsbX family MFS transporter [Brachybacterium saurashtrense]AXK46370.1 MFS transporter [Brachybacterium saurashtrense]RRR24110.1 MFS transporter [Brachybacterium saurashtrense]